MVRGFLLLSIAVTLYLRGKGSLPVQFLQKVLRVKARYPLESGAEYAEKNRQILAVSSIL
ncbi:MAG: hypothetical protein UX02_C0003G0024 [Candidatus Moranbacteria bacterium GW2011_GWC1_45_18]|nr:MAG: hypothetical protein UT79_C0004G0024 [Candidatus Moranbacteria bacterium GW2011_GWC2_40_12]KKT33633.1 MAG: hypothetical protein UW19_C0007G0024 [Candidatus Moranbacteria bacterium GW2011_GWF2_44_10]KKT99481.1 MAG: hypothetical protein UX02_C0003G0024 [Candidatus Moranbacteria bacterium GW2011_GWC1_45_18]OGI22388.1 MAG: hypothetical protein A2194_01050 [Candidatus Moranbacteria bacterium RIFOXYA1_FULL_44_8]OGI34831.1 MAG: hypothetical protein A2407_00890 [Candidatus Moranbacteria bacteri